MKNEKLTHDLHHFMRQLSAEMAAEYNRIQKEAAADPGTAGDQGEENWKEVLEGWLPSSLHIVTKGRILNEKGKASPQVDVLILKNSYPRKLLNKKHYLAAGVLAAFECKTTLKSHHISDAFKTAKEIKELFEPRIGSPYEELYAPVTYGILAHSHSWAEATAHEVIQDKVVNADWETNVHPRTQLDLICVANLATWTLSKYTYSSARTRAILSDWHRRIEPGAPDIFAQTSYTYSDVHDLESRQNAGPQPLGILLAELTRKLAWEIPDLRELTNYYRDAGMVGPASGHLRAWPKEIFSETVFTRPAPGKRNRHFEWDEWKGSYP